MRPAPDDGPTMGVHSVQTITTTITTRMVAHEVIMPVPPPSPCERHFRSLLLCLCSAVDADERPEGGAVAGVLPRRNQR